MRRDETEYGLSPAQYHAGLDRLWEALRKDTVQESDVFTLAAARIAELEAEVERVKQEREDCRDAYWSESRKVAELTAKLAAVERSVRRVASVLAENDGHQLVGHHVAGGGATALTLGGIVRQLARIVGDDDHPGDEEVSAYATAPLPQPESEQPAKPKCLEGVPCVLCEVENGDRESYRVWAYGPVCSRSVAAVFNGPLLRSVNTYAPDRLTPINHAAGAESLRAAIEKGGE